MLSYYMPISLVYGYTGVFCDIWTILLCLCKLYFDYTLLFPISLCLHVSHIVFLLYGVFLFISLYLPFLSC